jgi:hypothetical protein
MVELPGRHVGRHTDGIEDDDAVRVVGVRTRERGVEPGKVSRRA